MLKINDALAFFIEVSSLFLFVRWAYSIPEKNLLKILLAMVALTGFVIVWGLFFSMKARYPLEGPVRWILEFIVLYFPYLKFLKDKTAISLVVLVIAFVVIVINLFIQATMGRAEW